MADQTWNHRVIYHPEDGPDHAYYAIHECHYRGNDIPHSWTLNPVTVLADSEDDLMSTLRRMMVCCRKPVLIERDGKLAPYVQPPRNAVTADGQRK